MTRLTRHVHSSLTVAVLGAKKGQLSAYLTNLNTPNRMLLTQDGGRLPDMRPPVLLDTSSMQPLELARVLHALGAGRVPGWNSQRPFPAAAVVDPAALAHQRMLACAPAITAVLPDRPDPLLLSIMLRTFGQATTESLTQQIWLGLKRPNLDPCLDLCGVLTALDGAETLPAAAIAAHMSRATFYRRLEAVQLALKVTTNPSRQSASQWLDTLLQRLEIPEALM